MRIALQGRLDSRCQVILMSCHFTSSNTRVLSAVTIDRLYQRLTSRNFACGLLRGSTHLTNASFNFCTLVASGAF